MNESFSDRLLDAIDEKKSVVCVGIDPSFTLLPDELKKEGDDPRAQLDAIFSFSARVLKSVAPHAACVKFQSAYFEKYHWDGVEAYFSLIHEAKELGLVVIGDVKRGDIGATSEAYAAGHLSDPQNGLLDDTGAAIPDAITVNPFLGLDTIEPFLKVCREERKGIFVLVRTSNPGSTHLQDVKTADGRTVSELLADQLSGIALTQDLLGARGISSVGAVVGATQPQTMQSLRSRLPKSIFLLPGYGAQGATAEMTRAAFANNSPAIVSASRSVLYAHREAKYSDLFQSKGWQSCVERATLDMKDDLMKVIG